LWAQKLTRELGNLHVVKLGKDYSFAANYCPISLLTVRFKALERLILQRINPLFEDVIVAKQAGIRGNRSTCDQVLAGNIY